MSPARRSVPASLPLLDIHFVEKARRAGDRAEYSFAAAGSAANVYKPHGDASDWSPGSILNDAVFPVDLKSLEEVVKAYPEAHCYQQLKLSDPLSEHKYDAPLIAWYWTTGRKASSEVALSVIPGNRLSTAADQP